MFAVVTGGSSGIGLEIARLLAKRGYDLILVARRKNRLLKIKKSFEKKYSIKVVPMEVDLSNEKNCLEFFDKVKAYPIKVWVNNAGFGELGRFEDIPLDQEVEMIHTNIIAAHIFTKLFIKEIKEGYILNIASVSGFQPDPMMATYGATKSYLLNLGLSISYELRRHKNKVYLTTVCPGPVRTEFNKVANTDFALKSMSAKRCAKEALRGLFNKKPLIIPGNDIKLLRVLSKFAPLSFILPIEYMIQTSKTRRDDVNKNKSTINS